MRMSQDFVQMKIDDPERNRALSLGAKDVSGVTLPMPHRRGDQLSWLARLRPACPKRCG